MSIEKFPKNKDLSGDTFHFRLATASDREKLFALAQSLPESDLLFMRRDITKMDAIDAWMKDIDDKQAITILVEDNNRIIGYGTIYYNQIFWQRHIGELRVLVNSAYRNRGVGTQIFIELITLAESLKLDKVVTYIAITDRGARRMLEGLNLKAEAILPDWVKTRDNKTYDLVIMARSV